jgi:hypothetical protein
VSTVDQTRKVDLREWSNADAESRGKAVQQLTESPAWEYLLDALNQYQRQEFKLLMKAPPSPDKSEYERKLGELNGLDLLPQVAAGVVKYGRDAAQRLREAS